MWGPRSLRVQDGSIRPSVDDVHSPNRLRRIALLIHGYNNDKDQAETSYRLAVEKLKKHVSSTVLDRVWEFFWPGYEEAILPRLRRPVFPIAERHRGEIIEGNLLLTAPLYSRQVPKAREAGRILGRYLLRLTGPRGSPSEIVLIAHSLGCRVALEAVKTLLEAHWSQASRVSAVCLMAAAVPTYMVELGNELWRAASLIPRSYVLYSRRDHILQWFFPAGQSLAGEGFLPEAVGRHGRPGGWSGRDETMLRHSGYWTSPVTTPHLARLFGAVTREELPAIEPVPWCPRGTNELPRSQVESRQIAGT